MGKGKSPLEDAQEHQSTPLSSLKDPASFPPPPKRVNYPRTASSPANSTAPDGGVLGTPVAQDEDSAIRRLQAKREAQARAEEEANKPPPGPYRADTTGLSTAHFPKPPVFRPGQGTPPPPVNGISKPTLPPKLPPRLPPRQNSRPDVHSEAPPPPYSEAGQGGASSEGWLNQGAMDRLTKSGVTVPGFGIGDRRRPPPAPAPRIASPSSSAPVSPTMARNQGPQLGELQSRFANMSTAPTQSQTSAAGTSWAEKQAALKTANTMRTNPSKVSFSEMKGAAATANNFHERHGDKAAAGFRAASGLYQKYGQTDKSNSYGSGTALPQSPTRPSQSPLPQPSTQPTQGAFGATSPIPPSPSGSTQSGIRKKPPPPPPPKKRELSSKPDGPPPVPIGSKPKF